jgi:hypothetical protein
MVGQTASSGCPTRLINGVAFRRIARLSLSVAGHAGNARMRTVRRLWKIAIGANACLIVGNLQ